MNSRVNQLNDIGNDLEQYTRRECVEVQGIPQSKDENTDEIILKVGDLMGLKLDKKDIS
ncbi:partial, partial [Paramuricea clavata]